MELALKLLGILFGVLARTLAPYLRKLKQGKVKEFRNGYWFSALASFVFRPDYYVVDFPKV